MCTGIEVIGGITLGQMLSVGGTLFSAVSAIGGGQAQARANERNARISEQNAVMATQKAAFDEERQRERSLRLMGGSRAAAGRSGTEIDGSSSLDVMADAAAQLELEALAIRHGGAVQATGFRNQAAADRSAAKQAAAAGYGTAAAGLLLGVGRVASSFGGGASAPRAGSSYSELNGQV